MAKRLTECINSLTDIDNNDVLMFSPALGCYKFETQNDMMGYNYKLQIPFSDKQTSVILEEVCLKKFAVMLGLGSKHFDILIQSQDKLVETINDLLACSEQDFYFLTSGNAHAVLDVATDTEPLKVEELLDCIKTWIKSGSDDSDPDNVKDWTDESLNDKLYVYYTAHIDGVLSFGIGIKDKCSGWFVKCNRLGSQKPTIYPCVFKRMNNQDAFVPIIFDIYGITESKPTFKQNVDMQTNVSTIMSEAEDFIYDNKRKLNFEVARSINEEQYLKHLASETRIPKKFIKKGIIGGQTIESIVSSICTECLVLLSTEQEDAKEYAKNLTVFEKLCKSAGYAIFYQDKFCDCCYKTTTLAEELE